MIMQTLSLRTIKDIVYTSGMRVFVRASINVPIKEGEVQNSFRIRRSDATIRYLVDKGCRVILCGHIGRDGNESTAPIAKLLLEMGYQATHVPAVSDDRAKEAVAAMGPGSILVLENVRSDAREQKNDATFSQELASLADVYVNEAFAASHREHASIVGVPKILPSYVGLNFAHEYKTLLTMSSPRTPSLFMLGGAKFETKLPLIEKFLDVYNRVFVGGALANDFFKARGYEVGKSLVSDIDLSNSKLISHPHLLLPVDVVVTDGLQSRTCAPTEVKANEKIVDVGPESITMLAPVIAKANSILWNGPFGNYEDGFAEQTLATAKLVADSNGFAVVGGGDTITSIEKLGIEEKFGFLSTAGGAMLTFLEKGTLPAIEVLGR